MKKNQFLFVIAVISVFAIKCTTPSYELTGVVQDGLINFLSFIIII